MTSLARSDLHLGAFTADGPWDIDPESMPWRRGIDDLRTRSRRQVPELIRRRRLPPWHALKVGAQLVRAVAPPALKYRRGITSDAGQAALATELRRAAERLGTTYIKVGQLVGSADGMLPDTLVQEFKLCRDRVPPETFEHVRTVVEEDLGAPLREVFADFDPVPLAAASIAQVHAATLATGEEVVVKVQRPDIDRVVPEDIATMAWLVPLIEKRSNEASLSNLSAYVELFAETIVEELDFRLEAQNMLDVAAVLAATDERGVVVPRPHNELVTRRVLVMERLHGLSIDDADGLVEAGVDASDVFRSLVVSFFEGAMIHGVFHGDLHGGNMLVTRNGVPALLDFGITGRFDDTKRGALLGLMFAAAAQDGRAMLVNLRDLGGFPPHADIDQIAAEVKIETLMGQDPTEVEPEQMALQMRETMTRLVAHGARLPKELFLYLKGTVYLNGTVTVLASDIDLFAEMGHIYELFTSTHGDALGAIGLDMSAFPADGAAMAEQMRRSAGVDADVKTFAEYQQANAERISAMRDATSGDTGRRRRRA